MARITHPPSCHPRRVFGCPESDEKMREKGEKEEQKRESWKLLPSIFY